jgi:hypothetical protein
MLEWLATEQQQSRRETMSQKARRSAIESIAQTPPNATRFVALWCLSSMATTITTLVATPYDRWSLATTANPSLLADPSTTSADIRRKDVAKRLHSQS